MASWGRPRAAILMVASVFMALIASCSDNASETKRLLSTVTSWASSASMIIEARSEGTVSLGYATIALESCDKAIADLKKQLALTDSDPDVADTIAQVEVAIRSAQASTGASAKTTAEPSLQKLRDAVAALKRLSGAV